MWHQQATHVVLQSTPLLLPGEFLVYVAADLAPETASRETGDLEYWPQLLWQICLMVDKLNLLTMALHKLLANDFANTQSTV